MHRPHRCPPPPLRTGFLTNALNPKTTVFIVSLFMQAVRPDTPLIVQIGYGAFIAVAHAGWFSLVALCFSATAVRDRLLALRHWIDRTFGCLLVGWRRARRARRALTRNGAPPVDATDRRASPARRMRHAVALERTRDRAGFVDRATAIDRSVGTKQGALDDDPGDILHAHELEVSMYGRCRSNSAAGVNGPGD